MFDIEWRYDFMYVHNLALQKCSLANRTSKAKRVTNKACVCISVFAIHRFRSFQGQIHKGCQASPYLTSTTLIQFSALSYLLHAQLASNFGAHMVQLVLLHNPTLNVKRLVSSVISRVESVETGYIVCQLSICLPVPINTDSLILYCLLRNNRQHKQ